MTLAPIILWFRQDLRLLDNPALFCAVAKGAPIIPVYILDDVNAGEWKIGGAQRWWLHHSLDSLQQSLKKLGSTLVLKRGNPESVLTKLAKETGASAVCWNRCYEPYAIARDTKIKAALTEQHIEVESFNSALLLEPWEVKNGQGSFFKVFTPFWKHCVGLIAARDMAPIPRPNKIIGYEKPIASDDLKDWNLLPIKPNWAKQFLEYWTPGEAGAELKLREFITSKISDYKDGRDIPSIEKTSRLSPYLHVGEISPRQMYYFTENAVQQGKVSRASADKFLSEIGWREFSYHLLYHFPQLPEQPFQNKFETFPWNENNNALKAWQKGLTGYPIVDAGMRELWQTGWMHNRVRMIVASFLTKHLLIPWQKGEAWFWDTLVDADLASNAASWQWVAGSGADAAPYFRIFNPILQGTKFDPEGAYVRKWVPELVQMPSDFIHRPWEAPDWILEKAGVTLGTHYPKPIVEHGFARDRAMAAYKAIKNP